MALGIFNIALHLRSACFYVTISENFKRFQYFNFETDFPENENLFQKTGVRFLVESTKIENASFPMFQCEIKVKANRMVTTKSTNHEERGFASNYFIFLKILFQFKNLLSGVDLMYQQSKCQYFYFLEVL